MFIPASPCLWAPPPPRTSFLRALAAGGLPPPSALPRALHMSPSGLMAEWCRVLAPWRRLGSESLVGVPASSAGSRTVSPCLECRRVCRKRRAGPGGRAAIPGTVAPCPAPQQRVLKGSTALRPVRPALAPAGCSRCSGRPATPSGGPCYLRVANPVGPREGRRQAQDHSAQNREPCAPSPCSSGRGGGGHLGGPFPPNRRWDLAGPGEPPPTRPVLLRAPGHRPAVTSPSPPQRKRGAAPPGGRLRVGARP